MRRSVQLSSALALLLVSAALPGWARAAASHGRDAHRRSPYVTPDSRWAGGIAAATSLLDPRFAPPGSKPDGLPSTAAAEAQAECADRAPHPPIRIAEDVGPLGFILGHDPVTGAPVYRPGSGVTAGTGTEHDPYVIEGWCIRRQPTPWLHWQYDPVGAKELSDHVTQSVMIDSTESHVVVRGNVVPGILKLWEVGILVEDARNVTIERNTVTTMWHGIFLYGARHSVVRGNTLVDSGLWGIALWSSDDVRVEDNATSASVDFGGILVSASDRATVRTNAVTGNGGEGVFLFDSTDSLVEGNLISDNEKAGLVVMDSAEVMVRDNITSGGGVGMAITGTSGSTIRSNVVVDSAQNAVEVVDAWRTGLHANRIEGGLSNGLVVALSIHTEAGHNVVRSNAGHGIVADGSVATVVRGNHVRDNRGSGIVLDLSDVTDVRENHVAENHDGGVLVKSSEGSEIHLNAIAGNAPGGGPGAGLTAVDVPPVEAAENWWGCPGGPGDPACDRVEGLVRYDPWLVQSHA